jgi:hypothetical protein
MLNLSIDQAIILAILVGVIFGGASALIWTKSQIKEYKAKQEKKWSDLINLAMTNAYKAGLADGSAPKTRPSGNK